MDIAPDSHLTENLTVSPTTEAVDPLTTTLSTETHISKPQTRRIKKSLLLEPLSYNETSFSSLFLSIQSEDGVKNTQPIMTDEPNIQSESQPGVANDTPQQDKPRSYPSEQSAEYPRQNHTVRGTPTPLFLNNRQSEHEVEDPRPTETTTTNMRAESPSGDVIDTPTPDEPQSYPMAQIAEYLRQDPITRNMRPNCFSSSTQTQKEDAIRADGI